eukprot:5367529-Ditylum_brightwellii.AAC.1
MVRKWSELLSSFVKMSAGLISPPMCSMDAKPVLDVEVLEDVVDLEQGLDTFVSDIDFHLSQAPCCDTLWGFCLVWGQHGGVLGTPVSICGGCYLLLEGKVKLLTSFEISYHIFGDGNV